MNLMVGSHKSQNKAWDDGYDAINWGHKLRYEQCLLSVNGDFEIVAGVLKSLGFDLDRQIDIEQSKDGMFIIYTQDKK